MLFILFFYILKNVEQTNTRSSLFFFAGHYFQCGIKKKLLKQTTVCHNSDFKAYVFMNFQSKLSNLIGLQLIGDDM